MTTPSSTEKSPLQSTPSGTLTTRNHDRDIAGMTYVYPVLSRRAGGISVGINLNPNNACNWRCVYCQVPNLTRGGPPPIDLVQLEDELRRILDDILHGDFMLRSAPPEMRRLNDVALSGNGEPTSAPEFSNVVDLIGKVLAGFALIGKIKLVLITNGSLANKPQVQAGLRKMAQLNGEVWFKFDRATRTGLQQVNDTETEPERHFQRLKSVAQLCPTWIQTCMFGLDGAPPKSTPGWPCWRAPRLKTCRCRVCCFMAWHDLRCKPSQAVSAACQKNGCARWQHAWKNWAGLFRSASEFSTG
jgi:hypothetical protein